jgi:hypothetical protein
VSRDEREMVVAVRCIKPDGVRRVEFKRYPDRAQAEIDAAGLRRVGCPCEIVDLPRLVREVPP